MSNYKHGLLALVFCAPTLLWAQGFGVDSIRIGNANGGSSWIVLPSAATQSYRMLLPPNLGSSSGQLLYVDGPSGQLNLLSPGSDSQLLRMSSGALSWIQPDSIVQQQAWSLVGNAGTVPGTSFLGTQDSQPLVMKTYATERLRIQPGGFVGIGTNNPSTLLHLSGGHLYLDTLSSGNAAELRFSNPSRTFYSSFRAGNQSATINYTLPLSTPSDGNVLSTSSAGVLSWVDAAAVANAWSLSGNNLGGSSAILGTLDSSDLVLKVYNSPSGLINIGSFNTTFGYQSGLNLSSGAYNSFFGSGAGKSNGSQSVNTYAGHEAGRDINTGGGYNTILGAGAGKTSTTVGYSVFVGANTGGSANVQNSTFVGAYAGRNATADNNTLLGYNAGYYNISGANNTLVGTSAGQGTSTFSFANSTLLGFQAGYALTTGSNNILLGYKAGDALTSGSNNIIIGYDIDAPSATGSNQLSIGNLIFGTSVSGSGTTVSSGKIGVGVPVATQRLHVAGNVLIDSASTGVAGKLMLNNPARTFYTSLQAGTNTANVSYTLPAADGSNGQVLSTNGSGSLSWVGNGATSWSLSGNAGTTSGTNFLGTTDAQDLMFKTSNTERMTINKTNGYIHLNQSNQSTIMGYQAALSNAGSANVALGYQAMFQNTTGMRNVAVGFVALDQNISGQDNVAVGIVALNANTGNYNTGIGSSAGYFLVSGDKNVLLGHNAGVSHTSGSKNIFIGDSTCIGPATTGSNYMSIANTIYGSGIYTSTPLIGINTYSPGATLDVKGTFRLSGATSGFVGFAPAAAAGSTVYTLPSADGSSGQVLSTNGSGTLSWATMGSTSWLLSGNSGAAAPFLGTTDNYALRFRVNNAEVGSFGTDGSLRIGYTASSLPTSYSGLPNRLFMEGGDESYATMSGVTETAIGGPHFELIRSRGTYGAGYSDVQINDEIGQYRWRAYFGGSYLSCADIASEVDSTPSSGNVPGRIIFSTTPVGGGAGFLPRMTIKSDGAVGINTQSPTLSSKLDVQGNLALSNSGTASQLRFYEPSASGSNYSSLSAQAQSADVNYTLPAADGNNGDFMATNGSGTMTWTNIGKDQFKVKAADESLSSSTSLQDDDDLQFPVNNGEQWFVDVLLDLTGSTGGIKCAFSIPTGSTMALNMCSNLNSGNTSHVHEWLRTSGTATSAITITNGVTSVNIRGVISVGANAGNIKLQWAQSTSSGTATVVKKLSMLKYTRIQ